MKTLMKIAFTTIAIIIIGCAAKQSNESTSCATQTRKMIGKEYKVDLDFHNSLARAVNVSPRDHKGIKSLLIVAGLSCPEDSVATLAAPLSTLYFFNTPGEHHKLELLISRLCPTSPK
jgi:hypothetical protein